MQYLVFMFIVIFSLPLAAQRFIEDFESGNLNNWEVLEGKADLSTMPIVEGNHSLRLWDFKDIETPEALMIHKTFSKDFGTYSYYAMCDGTSSHADFYFHYQDASNYYHISHKATGTDTPEFIVSKLVNGVYTELLQHGAVEEIGKWVYISVERFCNGRMIVGFNNDDLLDIIDRDILEPGSIGLRSWSQYSFFDRVEFETYSDQFTEVDTFICQGQPLQVGQQIFELPGSYLDTFVNISGCDSIVTWHVKDSPEFDLGPDRAFCDEDLIISTNVRGTYLWNTGSTSNEIVIDQEGSYSLTMTDVNNCVQIDTIDIANQCELSFYTATIFSPNGDMYHDIWKPEFDLLPKTYSLAIYDRWGNILFQTNNPTDSWDGRFQNNIVSSGVYVWQMVIDSKFYSGDLTVVQ